MDINTEGHLYTLPRVCVLYDKNNLLLHASKKKIQNHGEKNKTNNSNKTIKCALHRVWYC